MSGSLKGGANGSRSALSSCLQGLNPHNPRILAGVGAVLMSITAILFFPLFETGNILLAGVATVAAHASTSIAFAAIPPILTQAFPSRVRYTGVSMAYQFGSTLGGGVAPMIATALFAATGQT